MNNINTKRKRKRKTRSERNQLSHHLTEDQQDKGIGKSNKESKKKSDNTKTLRAKKNICDTSKIQLKTSKTVTKDRLIVKRRSVSLAKSKSSDWIKRTVGSLPESKDLKKKVDLDMKQMLEMAEQLNEKEVEQDDSEVEINIDHSSTQGTQAVEKQINSSPAPCERSNEMDTSVVPPRKGQNQVSTMLSHDKPAALDSGFSTSTPKSATLEGDVDDTTLMRSVADSMLREPQFCCFKVFDKREYGNELQSEILEFWDKRKQKNAFDDFDIPLDIYNSSKQYHPFEEYDTPSALSAFRAFSLRNQSHSDVILQTDQEEADSIFGTPIDSGIEGSIFLPGNSDCGISSEQCIEPVIRICLNPEEMDTDQEDDDDDSGLSLARYEYFMASARRLKAEQKALQLEKQQLFESNKRSKVGWNSLRKNSTDMFSGDVPILDNQKFDWNSLLQTDISSSSSGKMHPVSKPKDRKDSSFSEIKKDLHSGHDVFDRYEKLPFNQNEKCRRFKDSPTEKAFRRDPSSELYDLSMSRHKLHTALQEACQKPSSKYSEPNIFSILDPDVPHEMDDIFEVDTSHDRWGINDLRTHQIDLQQQAHDFLSSHEASNAKSCSRFVSRSQLCPTDSPDSNGSPVWLASSVLKDMVL